jgi:hypothetical protein
VFVPGGRRDVNGPHGRLIYVVAFAAVAAMAVPRTPLPDVRLDERRSSISATSGAIRRGA